MQIELEIKENLSEAGSIEKKIQKIQKFMNWDETKLKNAIIKHGTSTKEGRAAIIKTFWGKPRA